jgi:crotonobetainyl-CoA:carnitine CoA-transferase CaiB-like acyl-CoA transferase
LSDSNPVLTGLRVVEIACERSVFAGKLFADMGADVVLIEPVAGAEMRSYGPFVDDVPDPEKSLYFWHYNTSKRGIALDIDTPEGRDVFKRLVARADVVIESEKPGELARKGLDYPDFAEGNPGLLWVSLTGFGRDDPRSLDPILDLTILAGGGPVWNNGYDDHSLPPIRGGGNQGYHTGCHYGFMTALVALLHRDVTGRGQLIDVSFHAAANVTTEAGSYEWLVAQATVQRQTGRHAATQVTMGSQITCADGRMVNTGVPPRFPAEFARMHQWILDAGLEDEFPEVIFLEMGGKRESIDLYKIAEDEELQAIFGAGREAANLLASRLSAYDFFIQSQERGFPVGIIYAPEEVIEDAHFQARGFCVPVEHEDLDRQVTYPGAPYALQRGAWRISRRAPHLGEHNAEVLAEVGISAGDLETLRSQGVVA